MTARPAIDRKHVKIHYWAFREEALRVRKRKPYFRPRGRRTIREIKRIRNPIIRLRYASILFEFILTVTERGADQLAVRGSTEVEYAPADMVDESRNDTLAPSLSWRERIKQCETFFQDFDSLSSAIAVRSKIAHGEDHAYTCNDIKRAADVFLLATLDLLVHMPTDVAWDFYGHETESTIPRMLIGFGRSIIIFLFALLPLVVGLLALAYLWKHHR